MCREEPTLSLGQPGWAGAKTSKKYTSSIIFTFFIGMRLFTSCQFPPFLWSATSREKMCDFMVEFLKCAEFHGKFTEGV